jgi:hypothetical protein
MEGTITQRIKVSGKHRHEDKDGNLISACETRVGRDSEFLTEWDGWRVKYCEEHRKQKLPKDFREGNFSFTTILYSAVLGFRGGE